jgi:hypothetical protein
MPPPGAPTPPEKQAEKKPGPIDWMRWLLVIAIVAGAFVAAIRSYVDSSAQICRDKAGDTAAINVCGPIGLDDALWFGLLGLVVFLLLLPDMSEISVTGIGSLKRKVAEQEKKVADQEKKTADLERFVVSQMLSLSIANSQSQNVNVVVTSEALRQARDELPPPSERLREQAVVTQVDPDRAVKLTQILGLYERILDIFATVTGQRRHTFMTPEERILIDHPQLLSWYREYREPFNTFRTARSAAAHNPASLSDNDLQTTLELGERLLFTMRDAVRGIVPMDDNPP